MGAGSELRQRGVVAALGVTQVLAWGCSYYLPAVLAQPITEDTGWPLPWIIGGLSLGLLVAGLCSPMVGRAIERTGGRPVLASSSALLGTGLVALGLAPRLPVYLTAWPAPCCWPEPAPAPPWRRSPPWLRPTSP